LLSALTSSAPDAWEVIVDPIGNLEIRTGWALVVLEDAVTGARIENAPVKLGSVNLGHVG
jgi:hypothetical protein